MSTGPSIGGSVSEPEAQLKARLQCRLDGQSECQLEDL